MEKELNQIRIDRIIEEETRKANERLGFSNNLSQACLKKCLTSEDFGKVYEGLWMNIIKICNDRLKNAIGVKKRYQEEMAKLQSSTPTFRPIH